MKKVMPILFVLLFCGGSYGSWCRFGKEKPGGSPAYFYDEQLYWRSNDDNSKVTYLMSYSRGVDAFVYQDQDSNKTTVNTPSYNSDLNHINSLDLTLNG